MEWIWSNKDWIFSGIGVALIASLITLARYWIRKKNLKKQRSKIMPGSPIGIQRATLIAGIIITILIAIFALFFLHKANEVETDTLTEIQAYYIAYCIQHEDFITENFEKYKDYLIILMLHLAEDSYNEKQPIKKSNPTATARIKREPVFYDLWYELPSLDDCYYDTDIEHYLRCFLLGIDNGIIVELSKLYTEKYLEGINSYILDGYLFVEDEGKEKLVKEYPKIYEEINITAK
ncbi:MAG: hypothetical protein FWC34_10115 [Bacteroidetes bacterium]|nr:hypothetical protein [Bacteroidota bacterium]MCL2302156.1 hypothetical protein [Lentimicrobiaceae bacterium]